jgi:uncharacterized protein YaeQ
MALPSTVHRATLQLSDIDRGLYETLQVTVARHPSETGERLVARLLAHALFFEPGLEFTRGICAGDEPDLWVKGPDDRVRLWVEVGLPEPDRLVKASRHAGRVVLVATGRSMTVWLQQHLPRLAGIANLTVVSIDQAFIARLASRLERSINWSVTITGGALYLTDGEETLETGLTTHLLQPVR